MENILNKEKSLYLARHAHNPVHWQPWNDKVFSMAKKLNKPVFVSIGYSSCHWCRVMEKESFEDEETAKILNEKYGITEADFLSSELELVPAFNAKSLGFDKSMVAGYGHDDKVCAYAGLRAILEANIQDKTAICILSDKEEVGSMGNTGMESEVFDYFVSELLNKSGENRPNLLNKVFCNSSMLSADVGVIVMKTVVWEVG